MYHEQAEDFTWMVKGLKFSIRLNWTTRISNQILYNSKVHAKSLQVERKFPRHFVLVMASYLKIQGVISQNQLGQSLIGLSEIFWRAAEI